MIKFLDLNAQYNSIKTEVDKAMADVIAESAFIGGKYVKEFEASFAEFVGAKYCVGVGNGTDALEIALEAANLPKGSEVLVPGNSFIASSEAVTRCGLKVKFIDVDNDCYTISAQTIEQHLNDKTSAIIAVHLYGHPCDMGPIMELAEQRNLIVIEDCAQAHGAEYNGHRIGSIGHYATFSFYPGKNLGAYGDGGAITTMDEERAVQCRKIANHGRIAKYDHEFEGRNSRLDGLQAAVLSVKLQYLERWTERRIEIADKYLAELEGIDGLILPKRQSFARQVYHLFVVRTEQRDALKAHLTDQGIQSGIHYPISLAKLDAYAYLGQQNDETFYNATDSTLLSLPIGEHLTDDEIGKVVTAVRAFFDKV